MRSLASNRATESVSRRDAFSISRKVGMAGSAVSNRYPQ